MKSATMFEKKKLHSLWHLFLVEAHNNAENPRMDQTLARFTETVYRVGMTREISHYSSHCKTCQITKSQPKPPAPLQSLIAFYPLETVAVDILPPTKAMSTL